MLHFLALLIKIILIFFAALAFFALFSVFYLQKLFRKQKGQEDKEITISPKETNDDQFTDYEVID